MANGYSWDDARDGGTYRLPGPEHLGWWAAVALFLSILLHVAVFLILDYYKISLDFSSTRELTTAPLNVEQVEVIPLVEESLPPEDVVVPPNESAALMEEIDLLAKLPKDQEIDIKPEVLTPEYALKMTNPAMEGEHEAVNLALSAGMEIESDLPDLGKMEESLPPAAVGQITVDPGAVPMDDGKLDKFTDELVKKGARGKVRDGALDGLTSLDDLIDLPANVLISKKTLLPSDLLFEFNSADLRESAKVGLMKLGLLIDRNPNLYCWVEGHTDLIGTPEANFELSRRRANAVREYLVKSLRMDGDKINPRGKGEFEPLIAAGTVAEQAPNRRVEIRMRKEPPPAEPERLIPRAEPAPIKSSKPTTLAPLPPAALKPTAVQPTTVKPTTVKPTAVQPTAVKPTAVQPTAIKPTQPARPAQPIKPAQVTPPPPKTVPVKPPRALPVDEEKIPPAPPKAEPVEEMPDLPDAPKAEPVDPDDPVESPQPATAPRAQAVEE